ncbi:MAG: hypothetical protein ISR65_02950 [Bacteriovoracaceae bacterium]|nr:hypothetical protein [Bacteriovoracaceae bacterium]
MKKSLQIIVIVVGVLSVFQIFASADRTGTNGLTANIKRLEVVSDRLKNKIEENNGMNLIDLREKLNLVRSQLEAAKARTSKRKAPPGI